MTPSPLRQRQHLLADTLTSLSTPSLLRPCSLALAPSPTPLLPPRRHPHLLVDALAPSPSLPCPRPLALAPSPMPSLPPQPPRSLANALAPSPTPSLPRQCPRSLANALTPSPTPSRHLPRCNPRTL